MHNNENPAIKKMNRPVSLHRYCANGAIEEGLVTDSAIKERAATPSNLERTHRAPRSEQESDGRIHDDDRRDVRPDAVKASA